MIDWLDSINPLWHQNLFHGAPYLITLWLVSRTFVIEHEVLRVRDDRFLVYVLSAAMALIWIFADGLDRWIPNADSLDGSYIICSLFLPAWARRFRDHRIVDQANERNAA